MSAIKTNEERKPQKFVQEESLFAQEALRRVGGSCVYIAPKKGQKLFDLEPIKESEETK